MNKVKRMKWACAAVCALAVCRAGAAVIDPAKGKPDKDGKTVWYPGESLPMEGRGFADTQAFYDRLPAKMTNTAPRSVWWLSKNSAGFCFRFSTDAPSLRFRWTLRSRSLSLPHMPSTGVSGIDIYKWTGEGWRYVKNGQPRGTDNSVYTAWTPGAPCLVYLPLYNGVSSFSVGIPAGKRLETAPPRASGVARPVVFYGTSITQGACASRPGMAFTAIAGRIADVPVVNLGFSGSGKMEMCMAEALAEIDAEAYVLDCLWNMDDAMVKERFEPFVRALRARRPDRPILLAEDCNVFGKAPTPKAKRARAVFDKLRAESPRDWRRLYYLEAKDMLGHDGEGTVDGCHPNDWGMMQMGKAFGTAIVRMLKDGR